MKLIIANMSPNLQAFIRKHHFSGKTMIINKMCNVKFIKGPVDVIIPFGYVTESGLISNTIVHLEELLMTVDVTSIKYGSSYLESRFIEVANKYDIEIEKIDIRSKDKLML